MAIAGSVAVVVAPVATTVRFLDLETGLCCMTQSVLAAKPADAVVASPDGATVVTGRMADVAAAGGSTDVEVSRWGQWENGVGKRLRECLERVVAEKPHLAGVSSIWKHPGWL